jgi:gluconate kinase
LKDEDCWDWYDRCVLELLKVERDSSPRGIVFVIAALTRVRRRGLRDRIESLKEQGSNMVSFFIYCTIQERESLNRVQKRLGHFAGVEETKRNIKILEIPKTEGSGMEDELVLLDCNGSIEENLKQAMSLLEPRMQKFGMGISSNMLELIRLGDC